MAFEVSGEYTPAELDEFFLPMSFRLDIERFYKSKRFYGMERGVARPVTRGFQMWVMHYLSRIRKDWHDAVWLSVGTA